MRVGRWNAYPKRTAQFRFAGMAGTNLSDPAYPFAYELRGGCLLERVWRKFGERTKAREIEGWGWIAFAAA